MTELELFEQLKAKLLVDIETKPAQRVPYFKDLLAKVEEKLIKLKEENKQ